MGKDTLPCLQYITFYWNQHCAIAYIPLLRQWIRYILSFFIKGFAHFPSVITNRTRWHYHTPHKETCIFGNERKKGFITKENHPRESFFVIIASEIRTNIHKVTTGWRYIKCLAMHWAQGISWPILHIMSYLHNK